MKCHHRTIGQAACRYIMYCIAWPAVHIITQPFHTAQLSKHCAVKTNQHAIAVPQLPSVTVDECPLELPDNTCCAFAGGPVCFFTFDKLCNANVGAADYIALSKKFHTVALSGVPIFTASIRNQAYRSVPPGAPTPLKFQRLHALLDHSLDVKTHCIRL